MHSLKYSVQDFPSSMGPVQFVKIEIADDEKLMTIYEHGSFKRKKKQKANDRKKRFFEVIFSFDKKVLLKSARISRDAKEISLVGRVFSPIILHDEVIVADNIELLHYYNAGKKKKVLSAFYMQRENPVANIHWVLAHCRENKPYQIKINHL